MEFQVTLDCMQLQNHKLNKAKVTLAPSAARFLKSKTKDSIILWFITLKLTNIQNPH